MKERYSGIVGESGCGKTTLGRCILRLIEPTSGTVKFDGQNVVALSQRDLRLIRRHMQIVFQDPYASLDPRWRVYDILEEPLRIHTIVPPAERSAEIARILGDVGLPPESAFRYPHEFSGGQRQRIGIARALALHPKFLIADEPVSALDRFHPCADSQSPTQAAGRERDYDRLYRSRSWCGQANQPENRGHA